MIEGLSQVLAMLGRTVPGQWILLNVLNRGDASAAKWIVFQSRDARATDEAFLGWLDGRRKDRPFFAFLNYFDAHGPYLPPSPFRGRFSHRPKGRRDDKFLADLTRRAVNFLPAEDILFARDCYDECIASRIRPATPIASGPAVSGISTPNSSPPGRAQRSIFLTCDSSTRETRARRSSPAR